MVKEKCEGKNFCELEATNEMYGNPCEQTHKYLEVNFHCQAGKNISKFFLCYTWGNATSGRFSNNAAWSCLLKHYKSTACWWRCVIERSTPRTPDLEARGIGLAHRVASLDKELYSTLSFFTKVYNWVPATYCWGVPCDGLASRPGEA